MQFPEGLENTPFNSNKNPENSIFKINFGIKYMVK